MESSLLEKLFDYDFDNFENSTMHLDSDNILNDDMIFFEKIRKYISENAANGEKIEIVKYEIADCNDEKYRQLWNYCKGNNKQKILLCYLNGNSYYSRNHDIEIYIDNTNDIEKFLHVFDDKYVVLFLDDRYDSLSKANISINAIFSTWDKEKFEDMQDFLKGPGDQLYKLMHMYDDIYKKALRQDMFKQNLSFIFI